MHTLVALPKPVFVGLTMALSTAFLTTFVTTRQAFAQDKDKTSPLVVRVAVFPADQRDYRDLIYGHLFPTLQTVPGYVGTFLGRDSESGQLISLSFWESTAAALAGEEALGRALRSLPEGTAPRPSKVEKYVVEYRDLQKAFVK
jgi:heme-degrading monooxygenase HmoA